MKTNKIKLTSFQRKVYKEVRKIKKGQTRTYKQIALALCTSPRAVARALSKNPFPIKIPCHRVIMSSGKLGGYSFGGTKKKEKILKKEKAI